MSSQSASSPNEDAVEYRNMMYTDLNGFRKERVLCDVNIVVGNREFPAHKLVLSTFSPFFKNMFCGNFLEASKSCVSLNQDHVEADVMDEILEFAYTGNIKFTCKTAVEILKAAHFLQVEFLFKRCYQFLEKNIDSENCLHLHELSDVYSCRALKEKAKSYFFQKFSDVCVVDSFLEIKLELLTELVESDNLTVRTEADVLEAVLRWVNFKEERKSFAPTVLRHVRLSHVDVRYLRDRIKDEETVWSSLECMQLLFEMQCDEQIGELKTRTRRKTMNIFVKTPTEPLLRFEVTCWDLIGSIKHRIQIHSPALIQKLIFAGVVLQEDRTLYDYNIGDKSTLYAFIS